MISLTPIREETLYPTRRQRADSQAHYEPGPSVRVAGHHSMSATGDHHDP
jgi:hypothetical protein